MARWKGDFDKTGVFRFEFALKQYFQQKINPFFYLPFFSTLKIELDNFARKEKEGRAVAAAAE